MECLRPEVRILSVEGLDGVAGHQARDEEVKLTAAHNVNTKKPNLRTTNRIPEYNNWRNS